MTAQSGRARAASDWIALRSPRVWVALNATRLEVLRCARFDGAVCRGPSWKPLVALTFDDGPDPQTTPRILEALERAGARATFFVLGSSVEAHPDLGQQIAVRNEVGTHLYSHRRGACSTVAGFDDEASRSLAVHRRVFGEAPRRLRFPFGDRGAVGRSNVERWGLSAYHWTFSSEDSSAGSAERIIEHVAPRLHAGAIVLFHDGRGPDSTNGATDRRATVSALPRILEEVSRRGLRAVSLAEMFGPG